MSDGLNGAFTPATQNSNKVTDDDIITAIVRAERSWRFQVDILDVASKFNKHQGPKNHLLGALVSSIMTEAEEGISQETKDAREYHNMEIRRIVTQHAEPGFDFDDMAYRMFLATGKQTRATHIMWAKSVVEERWAEEAQEAATPTLTLSDQPTAP